jgi:L-ascorbate metabolism protein UlaG (beta-lactamase superfamily)
MSMLPALLVLLAADGYVDHAITTIDRVHLTSQAGATGIHTSLWSQSIYKENRVPSEGRLLHNRGRDNGYIVSPQDRRVDAGGDTERDADMRALKIIDIAYVPMNQPYAMPPEAADAIQASKPSILHPNHDRGQDPKAFAQKPEDSGVRVNQRRGTSH